MRQIGNFFEKLFHNKDLALKWQSENWTFFHKWLYIGSDLLIWIVFIILSFIIIYFGFKKPGIPLRGVLIIFSILLFFSGFSFFTKLITLWLHPPAYKLNSLVVSITAFIAFITLIMVLKMLPAAKSLKTPAEFEKELEQALKSEKLVKDEMSRNHKRLEFLIEAGEMLASTLNYCDVLSNLSKIIVPYIADWCVIYEESESGSPNVLIVSHKNTEMNKVVYDLMQKYPPGEVFSLGISHVLTTGNEHLHEIVTDEDVQRIAKDQEHLRLLRELEIKSLIIVPLSIREKTVGALMVVISEPGKYYNEEDIDLVKETSRRAMLAIENARLFEESRKINALLEKRVEQRTQELLAINKELEAFSYSVSHDLRAPLRSIDGFSNIILKNYHNILDEKGKDYFLRVKKASQHMGQLIDDLLKLSQLSRTVIHPHYIDLSAMADSIISELKASDPRRVAEFIVKPNMVARVDHNLMQIALQNLFNNAWKYSKNKANTIIEFSSFKKDHSVVFFIKDNGVGFDMKYADKLFGSFQRLHHSSEFEGTGVGLATVQRIINRHNGTIWAVSEINKGATFYFII